MNDRPQWTRFDDAEAWHSQNEAGIARFVHRRHGAWRVSRTDAWRLHPEMTGIDDLTDKPIFEFEAETLEACLAYADFLNEHDIRQAQWMALSKSFASGRSDLPDYDFVVQKRPDVASASVSIWKDGTKIGDMRIEASVPETCFIAGQATISGHSQIAPNLIGKGLGRAMYDFAEESLGRTLLPSGRDFASGTLSQYSEPFWEKRMRHRSIPTMGEEAAARRAIVTEGVLLPHIERARARSIPFLLALADVTGGTIIGVVLKPDDGVPDVMPLWVETPDGKWLNATGPLSASEVQTLVEEASDVGTVLKRGVLTLDEIVAIDRQHERGSTFFPFDLPRSVGDCFPDAVVVATRYVGAALRDKPSAAAMNSLSQWYPDDEWTAAAKAL